MRVLVVEDEKKLAEIIRRGLTEEGYSVDNAFDGIEAEDLAFSVPYDVILLDLMLPKKDGIEVCRSMRQKNIKTKILMLTARDSLLDKVKGLDSGADDYLVKPFDFEELCARIRALLRREENIIPLKLEIGDLVMDISSRQVFKGQRQLDLTPKEYAMLEYLMRHPNMVITRTMFEQHVWDLELDSGSNLVDVFIRKLRRKIDDEGKDSLIQTVKGAGYRMEGHEPILKH
jgi:DNA-binding response OmpR family regulator